MVNLEDNSDDGQENEQGHGVHRLDTENEAVVFVENNRVDLLAVAVFQNARKQGITEMESSDSLDLDDVDDIYS